MNSSFSRRRLLKTVVTAATYQSVTRQARGQNAVEESNWPQYRRDSTNSGSATKQSVPSGDLIERWSFETDGDYPPAPLVIEETVYAGDANGTVYALGVDDGSEHWQATVGEGSAALTASGSNTVYVRTKYSPVVALDTESGTERWRFDAEKPTYCQPTFADGVVYAGRSNGAVYALDARSGERKWSFDTEGKLVGVPAVTDETVYVTGRDPSLLALDTESGSEKWRYRQIQSIVSPPTVVGKRLFVADGDRVFAFHTDTGDLLWKRRMYQAGTFSVAVSDDEVYVGGATEFDGRVNRLNALATDDGTAIWQADLPANPATAPVLVGDAVLVGCTDGNLYALDATSGEQTWQYAVGGTEVFAPAVVDGSVFVGNQHGVHALEGSSMPLTTLGALVGLAGVGGAVGYLFRERLS